MTPTPARIASVFIELTNFCNHHCTFCPSDRLKRPRGRMDPALFRRICDQLSRERLADSVTFHLMGEPFVHNRIHEFLDYAEDRGLRVILFTNGSLLDESNAPRVFERLTGTLILGMQTPDAVTFRERGVRNETFERYRDRLRGVVRAHLRWSRGARRKNYVEVHLLNTKHGRPGVDILTDDDAAREAIVEWWRFCRETVAAELGLDFGPTDLPELWHLLRPFPDGLFIEVAPGIVVRFKIAGTFANSMIDRGARVTPTTVGFCANPSEQLGILWDGCCTVCCVDHDGEIFIGNANDTPVRDIWFGAAAEEIRQGFRERRVVHPVCQRCLGKVEATPGPSAGLAELSLRSTVRPPAPHAGEA
jgi:hypothetical protein